MYKKNFVKILKFMLLSLIVVLTNGCSPAKSEQQKLSTKPVKLYEIPSIISHSYDSFWAEVDAGNRAQLSFQVPGVIDKLEVRDGQSIKKGQLLASLDPTDYQLAVNASQAQYDLAQTRYLRNKQLYSKKLISTDTLDRSETDYKAAHANLEEAKTDLDYTLLKAPFSGVISLSFVKAHQFVAAKRAILNIINNDQLDITISIPVPYVDRIGLNTLKNKNFMVVFDLYSEMIVPAKFKEMSTRADADTNSYSATMSLLRPTDINILTGMTGQVLVSSSIQTAAIKLPNEAWIDKQVGKGKVWRYDPQNSTVKAIEVKLNNSGGITDGLTEGDLVVIAGAASLKEGQTVRSWKREGGI